MLVSSWPGHSGGQTPASSQATSPNVSPLTVPFPKALNSSQARIPTMSPTRRPTISGLRRNSCRHLTGAIRLGSLSPRPNVIAATTSGHDPE